MSKLKKDATGSTADPTCLKAVQILSYGCIQPFRKVIQASTKIEYM